MKVECDEDGEIIEGEDNDDNDENSEDDVVKVAVEALLETVDGFLRTPPTLPPTTPSLKNAAGGAARECLGLLEGESSGNISDEVLLLSLHLSQCSEVRVPLAPINNVGPLQFFDLM